MMAASLHFVRTNLAFLCAGMLLTFTSSFGQTFFISIFSGEIRDTFGLSHGAWGTIYATGTFLSAIAMIWAGQMTDVLRVRSLCLIILPLFAAACLAMAAISVAWLLVPIIFALRFTGQGMTSHIATVAMSRWFVATRGRALSFASTGFAFGEAILPIIFVLLLSLIDWRLLWVLAACLILIALPVLLRLLALERTPHAIAAETASPGMGARHWRRADAVGHWLFWGLVPFMLGPAAFSTAFFFHQVHFANTKGLTHLALVALFPVYTGSAIVMMLISGFLIDRFGAARLVPVSQVPMIAAFLALGYATELQGVALGMMLMALSVGANHTLPSAFWAEVYGTQHLGAIKALAAAVMVFGTAIGPILTGILIDWGVSFDTQMMGIAVWFLLACGITGLVVRQVVPSLPHRV